MDKEQYHAFVQGLVDGDKTDFKDWEKDTPYFEGCMPIEVMAERGPETFRFGPMKGVGLANPRTGRWPYAVVQRSDEHTSELQSLMLISYAVFCLKNKHHTYTDPISHCIHRTLISPHSI